MQTVGAAVTHVQPHAEIPEVVRQPVRPVELPYVNCRSSKTTATASGVRSACVSNHPWMYDSAGYGASVRFHSYTTRRRSSSDSSASRSTRRILVRRQACDDGHERIGILIHGPFSLCRDKQPARILCKYLFTDTKPLNPLALPNSETSF
jgi:hypothetical protein